MIRGPQLAGLLTGLALAAVLVLLARPAAGPPLGLDLRLDVMPSGEVTATPFGTIAKVRTLRPGGRATGAVVLRNITAGRQAIRTAVQVPGEVAPHLRVRLSARGATVFAGSLADLRRAPRLPLTLASGASARVAVAAWIPAGAADAALRGRDAGVAITFSGDGVR